MGSQWMALAEGGREAGARAAHEISQAVGQGGDGCERITERLASALVTLGYYARRRVA